MDSESYRSDGPARRKRRLRAPEPVEYYFSSSDGIRLRLTRYHAGAKGPVILSHCIGVSRFMYSVDTINTNLVEFLSGHDFDVWLLDHRLSIELEASQEQSTLDDVATKDYPAAVAFVCERAGVSSVQIVAHGVGSSTFTMAMLSGLEGVRAAVCSQVSTHVHVPMVSRIKALVTPVLGWVGKKRVTAYTDATAGIAERVYNASLRLYPMPAEERCRNPVCHRVTSIYSNLYEHDQLNTQTHGILHELFGRVNITALRQLSVLSRVGHLVDAQKGNVYLPNLSRLKIPMAIIHGDDNVCVLPSATERAIQVLAQENGKAFYQRKVIPRYGHVDCIFGKNAATDVYPYILSHLEESRS